MAAVIFAGVWPRRRGYAGNADEHLTPSRLGGSLFTRSVSSQKVLAEENEAYRFWIEATSPQGKPRSEARQATIDLSKRPRPQRGRFLVCDRLRRRRGDATLWFRQTSSDHRNRCRAELRSGPMPSRPVRNPSWNPSDTGLSRERDVHRLVHGDRAVRRRE